MIGVVDYGLGNVLAIINIYKRLEVPVCLVKSVSDFRLITHFIIPGVGSFDHALMRLNRSGMRLELSNAINSGLPVLGICVGMQLMANSSEEGTLSGLGWIPGSVKRFDNNNSSSHFISVPHLGWNDIVAIDHPLFHGIDNARFYFLHSYYFSPQYDHHVFAKTTNGISFAAAVGSHNCYGVQFHPEKSHQYGIQLLRNFSLLR